MQDLAFKDSLTGLNNRHFLKERLGVELSNAQRLHYPLSLAIMDVDHFKRINDTYGHPAGDTVLRKLGLLLKTNVRKGTVVARWGGEEFLAVFPNMELSTAALIMERFRRKVENTIRVEERIVTISAGLAQVRWTTVRVWKKFKPGSSKKPIRISTQPNETGGTKCVGNP
jgi:diguanylate cyclase (GGDEF)-like protein